MVVSGKSCKVWTESVILQLISQQVMLKVQILSWLSSTGSMKLPSAYATVTICSRYSLESHACKMICSIAPIVDDAGGRSGSYALLARSTRCCFNKGLAWAQQCAGVKHIILTSIIISVDGGIKPVK